MSDQVKNEKSREQRLAAALRANLKRRKASRVPPTEKDEDSADAPDKDRR